MCKINILPVSDSCHAGSSISAGTALAIVQRNRHFEGTIHLTCFRGPGELCLRNHGFFQLPNTMVYKKKQMKSSDINEFSGVRCLSRSNPLL